MDPSDKNDEDEDVVIKGSSLYEHLLKLGYTDFESVTIPKLTFKNEEKKSRISNFVHTVKNFLRNLYFMYLKIIQDDGISKKQVESVLNSKVLLNDHGCVIYTFLDKYDHKPWRTMILKFVLFGTILPSSMYIFYNTQYRNSINSFALIVLCYASYMEYLRVNAHIDLKSLISLQNDLFNLCKKGMKILRYGYKIKLSKGKSSEQFFDLTAGRLKYLQPLAENLVEFLEHISCIYYHTSLILVKLLPANSYNEDLLTRFEPSSFQIHGEINYKKLKTLYHTCILTQSEMLHLLAIAYDNHIWQQSYKKIPELKLAHIIHSLIKYLNNYKNKLSENIDAYYDFKLEPISYKYKGRDSSQWYDLYMHLYLASNKLQLAYSHILSILQDIDNDVMEYVTNEDFMENTIQKLNLTQKAIETTKDFIEFSSLFLIKTQINSSVGNRLETNISTSANNTNDVRIISNSEPEIMDEVFEEYIKEEYLEPLSENGDEILWYNYKRDKTLFKNFMTELKDVLVDKKKSMSERESKALQRMYGRMTKETISNEQCQQIPTPPPMQLFNISSVKQNNEVSNDATKQSYELPRRSNMTKLINKSAENGMEKEVNNILVEEKSPIPITLPINTGFSSFLPPPFLKVEEETFVGSGENSDDEETEVKTE